MKAVVTGCAGFIGSQLTERLLADGHEVTGIDCLTSYYDPVLKRRNLDAALQHHAFRFVEADLAVVDPRPLVHGADLVFHEAGQPGVRGSWGHSFDVYVRNNISATQRLLEAVKDQPLQKFVYASSSSIYGDAEAFPTSEAATPRPISPYGVTKLAGEHLVTLYCRSYGVPTIALRYFTVYGPRQRPDMAFHRFIRCALEDRAIEVYGDGEQTRDFTFVEDALDANIAAAMSDAAGLALNIGGGSRVSVNAVIARIRELTGRDVTVRYTPEARGDVRHTAADTSLAEATLGYRPKVDLRTGLGAEVSWLRQVLSRELSAQPVS